MTTIHKEGMLAHPKVTLKRYQSIEHGSLKGVHAIVVHQTDTTAAQNTFNSYKAGGNGAHFLIDKDGTIYQTASMSKRCYHVGRLIKSKYLTINKNTCTSPDMAKILAMSQRNQIKAIDSDERAKNYPDRYPVNSDSIGIELVGRHIDDKAYETVSAFQNSSLQWLVSELYKHFSLTSNDIYRHPTVSYKNPGEASTATWK